MSEKDHIIIKMKLISSKRLNKYLYLVKMIWFCNIFLILIIRSLLKIENELSDVRKVFFNIDKKKYHTSVQIETLLRNRTHLSNVLTCAYEGTP